MNLHLLVPLVLLFCRVISFLSCRVQSDRGHQLSYVQGFRELQEQKMARAQQDLGAMVRALAPD